MSERLPAGLSASRGRRAAEAVLLTAALILAAPNRGISALEEPRAPLGSLPSTGAGLPADSAVDPLTVDALRSALSAGLTVVPPSPDRDALQGFYDQRAYQPLWIEGDGLNPLGATVLARVKTAISNDTPAAGPSVAAAEARFGRTDPQGLAELELLLSTAVVQTALNPVDVLATDPRVEALAEIADTGTDSDALGQWLPADPAFWRLRAVLPVYGEMAARGGWPKVSQGAKLELRARDGRVAEIRRRLLASGDLSEIGPDPEVFDEELASAIRAFQLHHGLADDAVVGFGTIDALNVPVEDRIAAIELNLARLHREQRIPEASHIAVNIPAADMRLVQDGKTTRTANVIVGRKDRPTPEIDSAIDRLEFNPFWTVPSGIYRKDLLPRIRKDPQYLASQNIRVYSGWTESANELDPDDVDWFSEDAKKMRLRLRQDPGPENALGPAKFLFPNQYDVYLHGTNKQSLFAKPQRFLSSGCVRVPDPLGLAAQLLQDDPSWPRERIDQVVRNGRNHGVRLATPLPVHLVYDTAWVDESGIVQFRSDVYGRDKRAAPVQAARGSNN